MLSGGKPSSSCCGKYKYAGTTLCNGSTFSPRKDSMFRCPVPGCGQTRFSRKIQVIQHLREEHHCFVDGGRGGDNKAVRDLRQRQFETWCEHNGYSTTTQLFPGQSEDGDGHEAQEADEGDEQDEYSGSDLFSKQNAEKSKKRKRSDTSEKPKKQVRFADGEDDGAGSDVIVSQKAEKSKEEGRSQKSKKAGKEAKVADEGMESALRHLLDSVDRTTVDDEDEEDPDKLLERRTTGALDAVNDNPEAYSLSDIIHYIFEGDATTLSQFEESQRDFDWESRMRSDVVFFALFTLKFWLTWFTRNGSVPISDYLCEQLKLFREEAHLAPSREQKR